MVKTIKTKIHLALVDWKKKKGKIKRKKCNPINSEYHIFPWNYMMDELVRHMIQNPEFVKSLSIKEIK